MITECGRYAPRSAVVAKTGRENTTKTAMAPNARALDFPERSKWAMLLLGFAGIGFMGSQSQHSRRLIHYHEV